MKELITIAVDAMGGDNSPRKVIEGIELHHKKSKNVFYKLFGNRNIIDPIINSKSIMSFILSSMFAFLFFIRIYFPNSELYSNVNNKISEKWSV